MLFVGCTMCQMASYGNGSGAVVPTPTPTPTPTPDNPGSTPTTIVSTGPETIVTGAIGAGSVVTTLGYFISSRKKLL